MSMLWSHWVNMFFRLSELTFFSPFILGKWLILTQWCHLVVTSHLNWTFFFFFFVSSSLLWGRNSPEESNVYWEISLLWSNEISNTFSTFIHLIFTTTQWNSPSFSILGGVGEEAEKGRNLAESLVAGTVEVKFSPRTALQPLLYPWSIIASILLSYLSYKKRNQ